MAFIGKIRENTLFVLIFIGLGIALFILMDIMSSNNQGGGTGALKMGEVGETSINRQEFETTLSAVYNGGDAYANRDALWNFYVNEAMVRQEAKAIGLGVSDTEMEDLQFGPNPSPVVRRNFANPQTGQVNRELLTNIQNYINNDDIQGGIDAGQLSPNFVPIWSYQSREVVAQRVQEKMAGLISKAMYAPTWMAQDRADAQFQTVNAALVKVPFDEILSSDINVADADVQAYLEDNRSLFTNKEETRVLSFVSFDVEATSADSAKIRESVMDIKNEWMETTQDRDSLFITGFNGTFNNVFYGRNALPADLADRLLTEMEVGEVYGPYLEGNAYKLAKLVDREVVADSVNTRHILISASTPEQFEAAEAKVDSLMGVLERSPGKWSTLAAEFSEDPGSKDEGGLYEGVTPGQFVKPFDDVIFRTGERGKLYSVRSQFGIHLVELLKRSNTASPRVKAGYIVEPILPSSDTEDSRLEDAQRFLTDNNNLDKLKSATSNSADLKVEQTGPLTINSFQIPAMGNNGSEIRDILCWAFSADVGDVSDRVYTFTDQQLFYENKHILVSVSEVIPEGLATVASVREELNPVVANRIKGQQLSERMAGKDLAAIAAEFSTNVDTVNNINLTLSSLPGGLGREPKVVAGIFGTSAQSMSAPIVGETGVYVVKPLGAPASGTSGSLPTARQQLHQTQRSQVTSQLLTAMRENLDLDDERADLDCR
ncbi:hypothetical protein CEQ90_01890 [Lewinellaceae bacterium SD302]|nr:hypothetical protein CEQ90_01890 [Lewinellaceae bacterium SD302]